MSSEPDANGWMPIETAPKDGTQFIGYGSYHYPDDKRPTGYILMVSYSGDEQWPWYDTDGKSAPGVYSHWQPLPVPPVAHQTPSREGQTG